MQVKRAVLTVALLLVSIVSVSASTIPADWWALEIPNKDANVHVSDDYSVMNGAKAATVEFWVKPILPLGQGLLIHDHEQYLVEQREDGTYRIRFHLDGSWATNHYLDVTEVLDEWHHVAFSWDGNETRIYLNGELAIVSTEDAGRQGITDNHGNYFVIGGRLGRDESRAYLTEIRVWNVARSQEEIKEHMAKRLAGDEAGLVAYWNFSEGAGPFLFDKGPSRSDALINFAKWVKVADTL